MYFCMYFASDVGVMSGMHDTSPLLFKKRSGEIFRNAFFWSYSTPNQPIIKVF